MATLVEDSAHVPAAVAALMAEYVHAIDDDRLEDWPGFFTDPCLYRIATRDNEERGLPASLVWCDSRAMLLDRVVSVRHANVFEPHRYRHLIDPPTVTTARPGRWTVRTNFAVYRTMQMAQTTLFCTGRYLDIVVEAAAELRYAERTAVCDSEVIDTLIVIPL